MLCRRPTRPRAARLERRGPPPAHPAEPPGAARGVGALVKLLPDSADSGGRVSAARGSRWPPERGAGTAWLRVADVARRARRERQHGAALDRRRAHRRLPQPRRPSPLLAADVRAPALRGGRREPPTRRLRGAAPPDAGPARRRAGRAGPHGLARRRSAGSAGESGARACASSPARRAAMYRRRRRAAAPGRLGGGGELEPAAQGAAWARRVGAGRGRPGRRRRHLLRAADGGLTRRARQALQRRGCRRSPGRR